MKNKPFDIADFVSNNKITMKSTKPILKATKTFKGYNDIRKTVIEEVKIKDGKFSIKESKNGGNEERKSLSTEVKKHFLEIISSYNTYNSQMKRSSDIIEVAETLGGIVEAARELTLNEAEDWFDKVTIKRNMKQLEKLEGSFDKVAKDAKVLDSRMQALYEEMGLILNRYYEISDIDPEVMRQRLGNVNETLKKGEIHKLEGKSVKMSTILNDGTVQIYFKDGTVLQFTHNNDTKIK